MALKFTVLVLWAFTAVVFIDLCKKALPAGQAILAVFLFSISPPFFLEWSMKARGGYAETVLFSVLLLWLLFTMAAGQRQQMMRYLFFGVICGIGLWASEMLLAMVTCAGMWLVLRPARSEKTRALIGVGLGGVIGLTPLIIYNATHDWNHFKTSLLYSLFVPDTLERTPLDLSQLALSAQFLFSGSWVLVMVMLAVAAARLLYRFRRLELGHLALLHTALYIFFYWKSGLRFLPIPPSRVLYTLYPGLTIVLSYALEFRPIYRFVPRFISSGVVVAWLALIALPVVLWIQSGKPRESGSWRGHWSLIDSEGMTERLLESKVDVVYTTQWTRKALEYAHRKACLLNPDPPPSPCMINCRRPRTRAVPMGPSSS